VPVTLDLTGRVVLVTGGARGIGRAIVERFLEAGADVAFCARHEPESPVIADGRRALFVVADVRDADEVDRLVSTTVERLGRLDVVVNNAATGLAQPVGHYTPEAWAKGMDVNLRGPVFLIQEALPHLELSAHAAVLNVISAGAFLFAANTSMYSMAKAALLEGTRAMAADFAPRHIRINALAPGSVDTDMVRNTGPEGMDRMEKASLMKRIADPDEMVGPALLLTSDAGSYITGQVLLADGGLVPH
jgi:NAD(P)-dependent dehydrogenase (short-subunit alcohol dehydrogenase family)